MGKNITNFYIVIFLERLVQSTGKDIFLISGSVVEKIISIDYLFSTIFFKIGIFYIIIIIFF